MEPESPPEPQLTPHNAVPGLDVRGLPTRSPDCAGERPGLSKAEREELVRLRRENRVLRMERDLLSRAAAFFAQEDVLPRQ